MTKRSKNIIIILIIGGCLCFFLLDYFKQDNEFQELYKEYPQLSISNKINTVVTDLYSHPKFRHSESIVFVTVKDGSKYRIPAGLNNDNQGIRRYLNVGDSICKSARSDTIFIFKVTNSKPRIYHFLISPSMQD